MTEISREQFTVVTAAEGGINYWADNIKELASKKLSECKDAEEFIASITGISFREEEENKEYILDLSQLKEATDRIVLDHSLTNATMRQYIVAEDIDADAADCIIQIAAFGKLVYG